jgi:hypothetical protein
MAMYAQTSGTHPTNSGTFVPIPGLTITLPEGIGISALVTRNLPNPYATGNNYPGVTLGIRERHNLFGRGVLHLQ